MLNGMIKKMYWYCKVVHTNKTKTLFFKVTYNKIQRE